MDSVRIQVPMVIKAKLTEKLKKAMIDDAEQALKNVDLELDQINLEESKATQSIPADDIQQLQAMHAHFGRLRQERMNFKAEGTQKLETVRKLAIGAEIVQGNTYRYADLKVGDNVRDMFGVEVLVEDDKVIAIRG